MRHESVMSDKTVPQTPPSTTLYPNLVTPPNSDGTIEKPILTYDFDWPDTSNAKVVRGSFRQLVDYSPSPSPRSVAKSQPKRVQRRDRNSSLSAGYDNVKRRGDIENVKESDENRSDNGRRPRSIEIMSWQGANKISILQRLTTHLRVFQNCHRTFRMAMPLQKVMIQSRVAQVLPQVPQNHYQFGSWRSTSRKLL